MLTHALLLFQFFQPSFHSDTFWSFLIVIYQNLMSSTFRSHKTFFFCEHNFLVDEKHTQWNLDTKAKVLHESISCFMKCHQNLILWNALKKNFHRVSLPLEYLSNFIYSYFWIKQTWLKKLIILANISTHFFH